MIVVKCRPLRDPNFFSQSRSRDSQTSNSRIFRDFQLPFHGWVKSRGKNFRLIPSWKILGSRDDVAKFSPGIPGIENSLSRLGPWEVTLVKGYLSIVRMFQPCRTIEHSCHCIPPQNWTVNNKHRVKQYTFEHFIENLGYISFGFKILTKLLTKNSFAIIQVIMTIWWI